MSVDALCMCMCFVMSGSTSNLHAAFNTSALGASTLGPLRTVSAPVPTSAPLYAAAPQQPGVQYAAPHIVTAATTHTYASQTSDQRRAAERRRWLQQELVVLAQDSLASSDFLHRELSDFSTSSSGTGGAPHPTFTSTSTSGISYTGSDRFSVATPLASASSGSAALAMAAAVSRAAPYGHPPVGPAAEGDDAAAALAFPSRHFPTAALNTGASAFTVRACVSLCVLVSRQESSGRQGRGEVCDLRV
jgi:hypothetical protein